MCKCFEKVGTLASSFDDFSKIVKKLVNENKKCCKQIIKL